jgi:DNA-binding CsgD family transcriptional regulator
VPRGCRRSGEPGYGRGWSCAATAAAGADRRTEGENIARQRHVDRHAAKHGSGNAVSHHRLPGSVLAHQRAEQLVDGERYFLPDDLPPPEDATEVRQRAPRSPTLRAMVRHGVRATDAEADDARLRRRQRAQALVAYGLRQIEIAEALGVSKQTVTADLAAARDRAPLAPGAVAVTVR